MSRLSSWIACPGGALHSVRRIKRMTGSREVREAREKLQLQAHQGEVILRSQIDEGTQAELVFPPSQLSREVGV